MPDKITLKEMDAIASLNINRVEEYELPLVDGKHFTVHIKTFLNPVERSAFVDYVANSCFTVDNEYAPEYLEVMYQVAIMQLMTDLPIPTNVVGEDKMKVTDVQRAYSMMIGLKIEDLILKSECGCLLDELRIAIQEKINFKKEQILNHSVVNEKVAELSDNANQAIGKITSMLTELEKNVNMSDLQKVVAKLAKLSNTDNKTFVDVLVDKIVARNTKESSKKKTK